jgi:hypothetical protein
MRILAVIVSVAVGLALGATTAISSVERLGGLALLAGSLAIALALGKTTTACGLNVLTYLSRPSDPWLSQMRDAIAYTVASAGTGAIIGSALGTIGASFRAEESLPLVGPVLVYLGLRELDIIRVRSVLSIRWQVPVDWVRNRRLAPLIWGVLLGSGLATWMPYPSFYGLLLLSLALPIPFGAVLMATYGMTRAIPAFLALHDRGRLVDILAAQTWGLRLLGHATTGCVSVALGTAILGGAIWTWN